MLPPCLLDVDHVLRVASRLPLCQFPATIQAALGRTPLRPARQGHSDCRNLLTDTYTEDACQSRLAPRPNLSLTRNSSRFSTPNRKTKPSWCRACSNLPASTRT